MKWDSADLDRDARLVPSTVPAVNPLDPYFAWAVLSEWRGYANLPEFDASSRVAFVAELDLGKSPPPELLDALGVASLYRDASAPFVFVTGGVPRDRLNLLRALDFLKRWELAVPVAAADPTFDLQPLNLEGVPLVGVIDDGLAVLNAAFEWREGDSVGTRIASLWDQNEAYDQAMPGVWKAPPRFAYGRAMNLAVANQAIKARLTAQQQGNVVEDEAEVYRQWGYLVASASQDPAQRVWRATHGTHVTSVVAGCTDPVEGGFATGDDASQALIAFVGLPALTAADPSGGSLAAHVMDGLQHIAALAKLDDPVVVVLSYGQHAGPHDGSSILECAMDELLARRQGRLAIVLGAGNSRRAGGAVAATVTKEKPLQLRWTVPERDRTDSFCEFWYRGVGGVTPTGVTFRVTDPNGGVADAGIDGAAVLTSGPGVVASLIHRARVPNGKDSMVLLAMSPSQAAPGASAPAGVWTIEVSVQDEGPGIELHGWVEREDPIEEPAGPDSAFTGAATTEVGTLNGIATGLRTLVAGGLRGGDLKAAPYSSLGPARNAAQGPHAWALCEESVTSRGIRAAAVRSAESFRMGGTSVAAPALARLIVKALKVGDGPDASGSWSTVLASLASSHPHRLTVNQPPDSEE